MSNNVNKSLIRNYLTLRYNPLEKPLLSFAKSSNFVESTSDPDGIKTEKLLEKIVYSQLAKKSGTIVIGLSSGIDSALTLAMIRKIFPKRHILAISAFFEGGENESIRAKKIARKFDAEFKTLKMDSTFRTMPMLVGITEKPRWNNYQHLIVKEAKKYGKLVYFGDGADELFGGYVFRYEKFQRMLKKDDDWISKTKKYLDCHNRDWVPDQKKMFGKSIKFDWQTIYNYFKPYFSNRLNPLHQVMLADFNGKLLLDFIPSNRKTFMYYRMTGNSIFLDKKLIDFALHLPISQKFDFKKNIGKITLRKITQRLDIDHIDKKKGFSPELYADWEKNGEKICNNFIRSSESHIIKNKLISEEWLDYAFQRVNDDADIRYLYRIISVLALEIWYKIFLKKEMNVSDILT